MEIYDNDELKFKINQIDQVASVIKSPQAKGTIFIPHYVKYTDVQFKVTTIEGDSFVGNEIQSITFPPDSEIIRFKKKAFHGASIKKLEIPTSLVTIEAGCFFQTEGLVEIEVSPKNRLFSYVDNKFLLGKTNESQKEFDVLIYARFDLKTAKIPSCIKILQEHSINLNLKSLNFPTNSKIEEIQYGALSHDITELYIPKTLKRIDSNCFHTTKKLVNIKVSPENDVFSYIDDKYLLTKSDGEKFDQIIFCRRDVKDVIIPNYIKKICSFAFAECEKLKSIEFEPTCIIKEIEDMAFGWRDYPSEIIIPESVSKIGNNAFVANKQLKSIVFLGKDITIDYSCFHLCDNLLSVSFPNAEHISFDVFSISKSAKIYVRKDAELEGDITTKFKNQVEFIKETATNPPPKPKSPTLITIEQDNYDKITKYVRFLENELSSYKEITPFNFTTFEKGQITSKQSNPSEKDENVFIDENDEKDFEIIAKTCEGSKCNVFKIFDHNSMRTLCKKVLKIDQERFSIKEVQNIMKEFEVLRIIDHPCICKSKFINISEKERSSELTTVSIYVEYLDFKLEDLLKNGMINNTMKVKIAVEIALGMAHLHKLGMIHRDLNISHIMLNSVFESKIIDFGFVKVNDCLVDGFNQTLTKKIGLLAFMSPEMANEDDYDNKTDVYSYGVILYVIFGEKQIDQALKEVMKKKQNLKLPKPSYSMTKNCIELIKRCIAYDPKERPSFDEIIEFMKLNKFALTADVDPEIIDRRIDEINRQVKISPSNK